MYFLFQQSVYLFKLKYSCAFKKDRFIFKRKMLKIFFKRINSWIKNSFQLFNVLKLRLVLRNAFTNSN